MGSLWINYLVQCLLATLAIFLALVTLSTQNLVIVASIGASAFIVFTTPSSVTAKPKNIICGHLLGFLSGTFCWYVGPHCHQGGGVFSLAMYSIAVGLSIIFMILTKTEHPPASGTALAIAIKGFDLRILIAILLCTTILSIIKFSFRNYIKDLI